MALCHRHRTRDMSEYNDEEGDNDVASLKRKISDLRARSYSRPPWRKVLWQRQPYPDNHVDRTFLNQLVQNVNFTEISIAESFYGATAVTQQISLVALFVSFFIMTLNEVIVVYTLLQIALSSLLLGFAFGACIEPSFYGRNIRGSIQTISLVAGSLFGLSPILHTLTAPFSDDTIVACTSLLLCGHLFVHDYSFVNGSSAKFNGPTSINAATFAAVLLGSRLSSNLHVFALVSMAIIMFGLFPILRRSIRVYSIVFHQMLTVLMFLSAFTCLLLFVSPSISVMYAALVLFVGIGCPLWLVFVQRYKNEIRGPWDEAVIVIGTQPPERLESSSHDSSAPGLTVSHFQTHTQDQVKMNRTLVVLLLLSSLALSSATSLTLVNNCGYTISVCGAYLGHVFDMPAHTRRGVTAEGNPPYNQCGSVQAEFRFHGWNNQDCYDLSEVAVKAKGAPVTIFGQNGGPTVHCSGTPCNDAYQFNSDNGKNHCVGTGGNYVLQCVLQWKELNLQDSVTFPPLANRVSFRLCDRAPNRHVQPNAWSMIVTFKPYQGGCKLQREIWTWLTIKFGAVHSSQADGIDRTAVRLSDDVSTSLRDNHYPETKRGRPEYL
ncbi:hypothetical protein PROFUN_03423 [Planoprotostelium fungivorum]|uniref:Phosphatidylinositol N-acetylglucosaminyltransferase subunit C n=1 Tax=Planoprotostelium fungivorum TaxID=1890364 RepID=A0A2P6NWH3_9EUKA|nr:hypothetical protein PROFUN_03423 [Planoprotostelium fungivorum]